MKWNEKQVQRYTLYFVWRTFWIALAALLGARLLDIVLLEKNNFKNNAYTKSSFLQSAK